MSHLSSVDTIQPTDQDVEPVPYFRSSKGILSWLLTIDHKRIGVLYLAVILAAFCIGGILAVLLRIQLMRGNSTFLTNAQYNQMFTMHGLVMIFLVIIPSIPAVMGNFILPIQLGAKDMAFPRLNLLSWYVYMAGTLMALYVLFFDRVDTGWTIYATYSTRYASGNVSLTMIAAFVIGFSTILSGLNFIVTIHKLRAPGMTFDRMPLFVWAIYATSIIQILATPVVGITLLLIFAEKALGLGVFDPKKGGDPLLYQHLFWFYSHPAVYVMIIPGFGVISEIISTFSRKPIFGYKAIAFSSLGIALIGFLVWGHHMFVSGQSPLVGSIFSFLTMLVAVPTAIKIFNWTATLYKAEIHLDSPMLYALGFLYLFAIGGLTGLFLASIGVDLHLHDSYFVVAHFHFVMVGGAIFAFFGGLHYWWPKITGKLFNETISKITCLILFLSFNYTFIPQFFAGVLGMARRYATYDKQFTPFQLHSSMGAYTLGLGFLLMAINLAISLWRGKPAPANPYQGSTLEWHTDPVPITENFSSVPVIKNGPYHREEA